MEHNWTYKLFTGGLALVVYGHPLVAADAKAPPSSLLGQLATANSSASVSSIVIQSCPPNMISGERGAKIIAESAKAADIAPRST
jgi:hypothetical protein